MLENFLKNKLINFDKYNVKLKILGKKNFSNNLNDLLKRSEIKTKNNKKIQVNLALNYGSKSEIINAISRVNKKKLKVTEMNISSNLYTKNIPDPEILIRTGNTKRLSNFLLWQLSYSEIFFEKKLWPDFTANDFSKIIKKYKNLTRNFGSI